jgi:hypothetical protein
MREAECIALADDGFAEYPLPLSWLKLVHPFNKS